MKHLKTFGGVLLFFGIMSIVMDFFNRVPSIMSWIYNWSDTIAWSIKIAFVVVGFALTRLGTNDEH